ncbi:MAG: hypothetical protein U0232_25195 [Thermomicrobiales bacterium]
MHVVVVRTYNVPVVTDHPRLGGGDPPARVDQRVPSQRSRPVASTIGRTKFTFNSIVVVSTPA